MRMLDNVIDINYYAVKKARDSNLRHRPVGLGIMGFQDCLYQLRVPYASDEAVEFADRSMEAVCYHAYWATTELAAERGRYSQLPRLAVGPRHPAAGLAGPAGRSSAAATSRSTARARWTGRAARAHRAARHAQLQLRGHRADGHHLQHHRRRRLDRAELRQPVGEVQPVGRVHGGQRVPGARPEEARPVGRRDGDGPQALRRLAAAASTACPRNSSACTRTAFEVEPQWLVEAGARRQKWIDQAQSLNIYMAGASGKKLDETYKLAWLRGLKTTYYLRTTSATYAEKSTVARGRAERGLQCRCGEPLRRSAPSPRATSSSARSTTPIARPVSERCECALEATRASFSMRCRNNENAAMSTSAWCSRTTL